MPGFGIKMIVYDLHSWNLTCRDGEVEGDCDIFNRSTSEMLQVRDTELVGVNCLTISTALNCAHY